MKNAAAASTRSDARTAAGILAIPRVARAPAAEPPFLPRRRKSPHAIIPAPEMPLLWHPLLLLNHVTILSTLAYVWEQKRPALTPLHWWTVLGMLGFIDAASIGMIAWRRPSSFWIQPSLLVPAAAVLLFIGVASIIRLRMGLRREAGQTLMLYGLLWLIVYDACFVYVYNGLLAAALLLLLLPAAYFSVQIMRGWSKLMTLSQKPTFKRA